MIQSQIWTEPSFSVVYPTSFIVYFNKHLTICSCRTSHILMLHRLLTAVIRDLPVQNCSGIFWRAFIQLLGQAGSPEIQRFWWDSEDYTIGKQTKNDATSSLLMGKSTMSMAINGLIHIYIYINIDLVSGIPTPLKNMTSTVKQCSKPQTTIGKVIIKPKDDWFALSRIIMNGKLRTTMWLGNSW